MSFKSVSRKFHVDPRYRGVHGESGTTGLSCCGCHHTHNTVVNGEQKLSVWTCSLKSVEGNQIRRGFLFKVVFSIYCQATRVVKID